MIERINNGAMRKKALEMGLVTEADLEVMVKDWREWIASEDACIGCLHGEIVVRK